MNTWRWYAVRIELAAAIVLPIVALALVVSAPTTMGPDPTPGPLGYAVAGTGISGLAIGLGAMIRIYRADPERHRSSWRSQR